jgi:glycosyltransferase involved in cell wall biosynthesis
VPPLTVCYFGAFDPAYARNASLRRGLELHGCRVVMCNSPLTQSTLRKTPSLIRQYAPVWRQSDVIVVAEFCQTLAPLAWLLGALTGRPMVFDLVISLYEAIALERFHLPPRSRRARKYYWLDWTAGRLAAAVLTGTTPYKEFLTRTFSFDEARVHVVPLCVDDDLFRPTPGARAEDGLVRVIYFGAYVPNHGVETVIEAAARLGDAPQVRFRLVGDGPDKPRIEARARELGVSNVEFCDRVPAAELPALAAEADVVLGNFGVTSQADHAMANKVLQGLAMRKAVITGDTAATRENFEHGRHLWLCPPGEAGALAEAVRQLAADPALRDRLAEAGYARVKERLTSERVGARLVEVLEHARRNGPRRP